ncbi:hypothetical protein PQJ75_11470 [Rhodoplanes sp. TEM]|uniref:Uncharacterized protein n=1 Tax=Rhodoplanes tepidamans TaxID=200616 RepID=A0ABT5J732_RHOTP|nr:MULTISPECIES: hypothetical protein [Rhodoplanes]MDC7785393.1 hypothetical protein [Rhodoplanes tepidamans]MDC7984352.1 hypothetical protein [Rhodoplanes sp. TEM]MDQ0353154.1 hypothetical protein [Rhodoplanes tepidamans]
MDNNPQQKDNSNHTGRAQPEETTAPATFFGQRLVPESPKNEHDRYLEEIKLRKLNTFLTAIGAIIGSLSTALALFALLASQDAARSSRIAATEAKRQADAALADQRAWLGLESVELTDANPLWFDSTGSERNWRLRVKYTVRNSGRSPAREFRLDWKAIVRADNESHLKWRPTQDNVCDNVLVLANIGQAAGDRYMILPGATLSQWDIIKIPIKQEAPFSADIVGCITYRTTIDEAPHQSGITFTLSAPGPSSKYDDIFPSIAIGDPKVVPKDKLQISRVFTAGRVD